MTKDYPTGEELERMNKRMVEIRQLHELAVFVVEREDDNRKTFVELMAATGDLLDDNDRLKKEIEELKGKLAEQPTLVDKRPLIDDEQVEPMMKKISDLETELEAKVKVNEKCLEHIDQLSEAIEKEQSQALYYKEELEKEKRKVLKLEKEVKDYEEDLSEKDQALESMMGERNLLQGENEKYEEVLKKAREEKEKKDELLNRVGGIVGANYQNTILVCLITQMERKDKLEQEKKEALDHIRGQTATYQALERDKKALEEEIYLIKAELKGKQAGIDEWKIIYEELEQEKETFEIKDKKVTKWIGNHIKKYKALEEENKELRSKDRVNFLVRMVQEKNLEFFEEYLSGDEDYNHIQELMECIVALEEKVTTLSQKDKDMIKADVFVNHIKGHLSDTTKFEPGIPVICKICNKTIDEIFEEKEPPEPGYNPTEDMVAEDRGPPDEEEGGG